MTLLEKIKDVATDVMNLDKKVKLAQMTLDNGTVIEAESFEAGQPVFIVNEDERVPLPVGDYEVEGGIISVTEEGIINEIKQKDMEDPGTDKNKDFVTVEDFNKAMDDLKSMLSKQEKDSAEKVEKLETELSEAKKESVKLQKEIDETPDAVPLNTKAQVQLNEVPASTKKGRIYQFLNNR